MVIMKKDILKEFKKTISFPTYHYKIHVVVTNDVLKSREKRSHILGLPDPYNPADKFIDGMHSWRDDSFEAYIFLKTPSIQSTLVHEAYHAVSRMFSFIGEDKAGEEIFAYTLGYLVEEMFAFIDYKKRK